MKELLVNVALNLPIDSLFTYKIPPHLADTAEPGKRVLVNFGKKVLTGVIVEKIDSTELKKIRQIRSVVDQSIVISDEMIRFCRWISDYYVSPLGEVIFSAIPGHINTKSDISFSLSEDYEEKLNELKHFSEKDEILIDIIKLLESGKRSGLTAKLLASKLNVKDISGQLKKLTDSGIIISGNLYSKPTREKLVKIVRKNFNHSDIALLIKELKLRSKKQILALELLSKTESVPYSELKQNSGISLSSLRSLEDKDLIKIKEVRVLRDSEGIFTEDAKEFDLNEDQINAVNIINESIEEKVFKCYMLHGVTGSGKTEIYIDVIKKVLKKGKTAIVLVPEISLTPQLIHRFRNVFGEKAGVIHSKLSAGERLDTFDRIVNGSFKIIIGARSALFAPLKNIGIIIADEEHDSSYKQENSPRYNGRDSAIYRAKLNNAVMILGSATPSVESYYNALSGKYELINLPERISGTNLPEIKIVDLLKRDKEDFDNMKRDFFDTIDKVRIRFLSKELIFEIGERLAKGESTIILQNRRGYHSYLECIECGHVEMCTRCSISLTYHKAIDTLKCHYCGLIKRYTGVCTECKSTKLIPKGAGTERVEEELQKIFPLARIKRLDSDSITSGKMYQQILKDFYDKKIDILTGTQIISKGLDFPDVTLAAVVNADLGLLTPDFRATEKTFQILTQISGRSGRSVNKGEVIIQTNHSDFDVFNDVKNHDYKRFYENEIKIREQLNYPPFSRLVIIETRSEDKLLAESKIRDLYNFVKSSDSNMLLEILPPIPPLFSKLKDNYRFHLIIKSSKEKDISGRYLNNILRKAKAYGKKNFPGKVSVTVDVDAVNLL
ncbi:MAG: primosomal protein N' [Ignavibacteriae bacterium]|nr:primosomal protein N' [Ignavibacteriota bacterium]